MIITYFGNPGCGKTTQIAKLLKKNQKYYKHTTANIQHTVCGSWRCYLDDLGKWTFPPGSFICIDEAGIEYNNRAYKTLPKEAIRYFKTHRHYRHDIAIFSQSFEDMDITLRRLSDQYWYLRKIGPFTLQRRVFKRVMVDERTYQIIDGYTMASPLWLFVWFLQLDRGLLPPMWKLTFRPFYYKYFDSYTMDIDKFCAGEFVEQRKEIKTCPIWIGSIWKHIKKIMEFIRHLLGSIKIK